MSALTLPEIARALGGEVSGRQVLAPGPGHSRKDRSLAVTLSVGSPDGFIVFSHATDDFRECKDYVRERLGRELPPQQGPCSARMVRRREAEGAGQEDRERRARYAFDLWRNAINPRGTLVEVYLRSRGLDLPDEVAGQVLRYHGRCPWKDDRGVTNGLPTMLAAMRDIRTGDITAVHRTALTREGQKVGRRMLGPSSGTAVKIDAGPSSGGALTVGEGIESCLAARQLGYGPVWALCSVGAIAKLPVLSEVSRLTILEERNDQGASRRAVTECAARWHLKRREVRAVLPRIGDDMNDALRGEL